MFSHLAFFFTLLHIAIHMTQPQNRFLWLYPFQIAQLTFIIALGCHLMAVMSEDKPFIRFGPATIWCLILMPLALLLQYNGAFMTDTSWNGYIDNLMKCAAAAILLEATATNIYRIWAVQAALVISTLWWFKAGVRFIHIGGSFTADRIMGPGVSMVQNPNAFAYFMCVMTVVFFYFFQQYPKPRWMKLIFLGMVLVGFLIVLNTGSRSGLITLGILSIALIPRYGGKHKLALVVMILVAPILWANAGEKNIERFKTMIEHFERMRSGEELDLRSARDADDHSAIERTLKQQAGWEQVKQYPWGVGMNANQDLLRQIPHNGGEVHNEILMAGRQMGWPGMMMYSAMLGILFWQGRKVMVYAKGWWPAMSDLGWSFRLQAVVIAAGGWFNPMPWNILTFVLMASASALWMNLKEGAVYPEGVMFGSSLDEQHIDRGQRVTP
jgi:O-antigen ligase